MNTLEIERLFDLSTVANADDRNSGRTIKRIISIPKPYLHDSTISHIEEKYVTYERVENDSFEQSVHLNFIKPCGVLEQQKGNAAMMPSLRLDMLDKEYQEPVRDRDKDWILHSQRPIINEKGKDIVEPSFDLHLGKYRHVESVSKMFWAPEYQTMLREQRLLRQAAIISDTNCIVEIFGVGFNGRIFSEGAQSPKFLVVEVYSIWNCQKYQLVLTVLQLRLLLASKPELLKPGRRSELLQYVLHSLYFDYTITIPIIDPKGHVVSPNNQTVTTERTDMHKSMDELGISKHQRKIELKQLLQHELNVQHHALNKLDVEHVASDWVHSPKYARKQPDTAVAARSQVTTPKHGVETKTSSENVEAVDVDEEIQFVNATTAEEKSNSVEEDITDCATSHAIEAAPSASETLAPASHAHHVSHTSHVIRANVQTVSHLQPPVMPRGYPTTIEQMIRIPPVQPENSSDPLPIVTQELKISSERRQNGITLRKQEAELRRIAQEKEEKRLRAIWLATPKHKRDRVGVRLIRKCNFLVILTAFFDPLRPGTIVMTGFVYNEATHMSMFLGLGRIKDLLGIKTKPDSWSNDELKAFMKKILQRSGIVRTRGGGYAINVAELTGMETALRKVRTVEEFLFSVNHRRRPTLYVQWHTPDNLSPFYVPLLEESRDHNKIENDEVEGADEASWTFSEQVSTRSLSSEISALDTDLFIPNSAKEGPESLLVKPFAAPTVTMQDAASSISSLNLRAGWTSLGARQSSRCVGRALGSRLRPFRELGRPQRLTSRVTRVSGIHCVYSLYANTAKMNIRRPIPVWPVHVPRAAAPPPVESVEEKEPEGSDQDEDFMRTGDSSEEESDTDNDAPTARKSNNQKDKKTKAGKAAKKSGSDGFEDSALDEEDEDVNEADLKNDVYITLSEGLELEFLVYLPAPAEYQGLPVPASTMKIIFSVNDLDRFFPFEEREMVARALRAVYRDFFDTASATEVQQAEVDWDFIGRRIMSRSRWVVRRELSPELRTALLDLQFGGQSIDVLQEMFCTSQRLEFAETLLWSDAQVLSLSSVPAPHTPQRGGDAAKSAAQAETPLTNSESVESVQRSIDVNADVAALDSSSHSSPPFVTLAWSNVVYSKAIKVRSAVTQRGDVRVQVIIIVY